MIVELRKGESLVIGDGITVTVCRIDGTQARIGVEAPRDVSVVRDELMQRQEERRDGQG